MSGWSSIDTIGLRIAITQARKSYDEGGIPIGSALLIPTSSDEPKADAWQLDYVVLGQGHNERIQKSSAILHGEMSALENAGRLKAEMYRKATISYKENLFTVVPISPCSMCTGAILLYKIPRVVIGENTTFMGGEDLLRQNGVEVVIIDDAECKELMQKFIKEKPEEWNEDIGEAVGAQVK